MGKNLRYTRGLWIVTQKWLFTLFNVECAIFKMLEALLPNTEQGLTTINQFIGITVGSFLRIVLRQLVTALKYFRKNFTNIFVIIITVELRTGK